MDTEQKHKDAIDGFRAFYDLFKHLTTLSAGSLLLLTTLLEKFFHAPSWKFLIGLTFFSLIVSLISSLGAMLCYSAKIYMSDPGHDTILDPLGGISLVGSLGGFVLGLASIAAFSLRNFYQ